MYYHNTTRENEIRLGILYRYITYLYLICTSILLLLYRNTILLYVYYNFDLSLYSFYNTGHVELNIGSE